MDNKINTYTRSTWKSTVDWECEWKQKKLPLMKFLVRDIKHQHKRTFIAKQIQKILWQEVKSNSSRAKNYLNKNKYTYLDSLSSPPSSFKVCINTILGRMEREIFQQLRTKTAFCGLKMKLNIPFSELHDPLNTSVWNKCQVPNARESLESYI